MKHEVGEDSLEIWSGGGRDCMTSWPATGDFRRGSIE